MEEAGFQWSSLPGIRILPIYVGLLLIGWYSFFRRDSRLVKYMREIGGPEGVPGLGSALQVAVPNYELLGVFIEWRKAFGGVYRFWLANRLFVILSEAKAVEKLLSSSINIEKSEAYEPLHPWLQNGLLTSKGKAWSARRKLLTPAFHFKILEDFLDVFNEQSSTLVRILLANDCADGKAFDVFPYVTRCTLDVICETAMGKKLNAQTNQDQDYVQAIYKIGEILIQRSFRPWLRPDFIWNLTWQGREEKKLLKVLHGFTENVIAERRSERAEEQVKAGKAVEEVQSGGQERKRLAFLDLLFDAAEDGKTLTDLDIRIESDTFVFEGHDTSAANLVWTLFLLGSNPEAQKKMQEELDGIFGTDLEKKLNMADLASMKYVECCVKESLRIFPSVPLFGRCLSQDITLDDGRVLPAGCTVMVHTYLLHRDTSVFPDPEKFQPERFSAEAATARNLPFAYVPFSAGPRNCIGQKFAMMVEKVILARLFVHFNVEAVDEVKDIRMVPDLILRPLDGIRLKLTRRK